MAKCLWLLSVEWLDVEKKKKKEKETLEWLCYEHQEVVSVLLKATKVGAPNILTRSGITDLLSWPRKDLRLVLVSFVNHLKEQRCWIFHYWVDDCVCVCMCVCYLIDEVSNVSRVRRGRSDRVLRLRVQRSLIQSADPNGLHALRVHSVRLLQLTQIIILNTHTHSRLVFLG